MLLKELYNQAFLANLSQAICAVDEKFDVSSFCKITDDPKWQDLALKQRMRQISISLNTCLSPKHYSEKILILQKSVSFITEHQHSGLTLIIFPDFVEMFGLDFFDESMKALAFLTQFGSSEFAVRQFIKIDQKAALTFFDAWSKSDNHHIRRLASEGCRPRLPWGQALPSFKEDPSPILPILERLKNDESEYVRRSVANNLNDISKDNPTIVLEILKSWQSNTCPRLIKHALRTLLKLGDKKALKLVGIKTDLEVTKNFSIKNFYLKKTKLRIGENLEIGFALQNQSPKQNIRLEYILYFLKKNGGHSRKVFQITSKEFSQGMFDFNKKHSLKNMTTRKHHPGLQAVALVMNGFEIEKKTFELF